MEKNSRDNKYKIESQLREQYGKVVYTYTCHLNIVDRYKKIDRGIKLGQIMLSGITSAGFISIIFYDTWLIKLGGAVLSFGLFFLNSCIKFFEINNKITSHKKAADELWLIREQYLSLITDINILEIEKIIKERERLIRETSKVYKASPSTDSKSFKAAQKALKEDEHQYFTSHEIDIMLPEDLRRNKKD